MEKPRHRELKRDLKGKGLAWGAAFLSPAALLTISLFGNYWPSQPEFRILILGIFLFAAACTDCHSRIIPNWIAIPLAFWGVCAAAAANSFAQDLVWLENEGGFSMLFIEVISLRTSLAALGICFGIMFFVHLIGGAGAGDVKLCGGVGAAIGIEQGVLLICYAYILAAISILVVATIKGGFFKICESTIKFIAKGIFPNRVSKIDEETEKQLNQSVPFALFLAIAWPVSILLNNIEFS